MAVPLFAGAAAKSLFEGEATLTDAQAADLLAGKLYANIHTEANKAGGNPRPTHQIAEARPERRR